MNAEQITKEIEKFESNAAKIAHGSPGDNAALQIELIKAVWEVARQLAFSRGA